MQVPILSGGERCGTLEVWEKGLYSCFRGVVKSHELCRLFAVFPGGEIGLGIPAPEGGNMAICVSMPTGRLPDGALQYGYLQPVHTGWRPFPGDIRGGVQYPAGCEKDSALRFPWHEGEGLPCMETFCFFKRICDDGREWLEIRLNDEGHPMV